jgi:hypothetical protein
MSPTDEPILRRTWRVSLERLAEVVAREPH